MAGKIVRGWRTDNYKLTRGGLRIERGSNAIVTGWERREKMVSNGG